MYSPFSSYYAVFMQQGRVVLQYGDPSGGFSLVRSNSLKTYNDGNWYQVCTQRHIIFASNVMFFWILH